MPKLMNNRFMMNLQLFAGEEGSDTGEESGDGGGQDDDQ